MLSYIRLCGLRSISGTLYQVNSLLGSMCSRPVAALQVCVEQGKIKGKFTSIIMTPMPALITTTLASLKCANAAGVRLSHVLFLYREQINRNSLLKVYEGENVFFFFFFIPAKKFLPTDYGNSPSLAFFFAFSLIYS